MTTKIEDLLSAHRLDLQAIEDGVWLEHRGDRFKIARMGNDLSTQVRTAWLAENGLAANADIPAHKSEAWKAHVFARAILRGIEFKQAPDVAYEPEMGEKVWSDPQFEDLRNVILARAGGDYTHAYLTRQAVLGNSKPHSTGNASAAPSEEP